MVIEYALEDLRSKQAMPGIRTNSRWWAIRKLRKELFSSFK